jgi:Flp pilus assembly protein TadD
MNNARIEALMTMVSDEPNDTMARFMLATELYKEGHFEDSVVHLEAYLKLKQDEGPAYQLLGDALTSLGRNQEARWAFRHGVEAAREHGHSALASELEERLERK